MQTFINNLDKNKELKQKLGVILLVFLFLEMFTLNIIKLLWLALSEDYSEIFVFESNIDYIYIVSAYICIACLILIEINTLAEFHIDKLSLITLIISSSFFRTRLGIPGETYYLVFIWLTCFVMTYAFVIRHSKIPRTNSRWVVVGIYLAIFVLIPLFVIETIQLTSWWQVPESYQPILSLIQSIIQNLSFASPIEETIFRGFLWGYLLRRGLKENSVIMIQAVLFWLLHFPQIFTPLTFFVSLPIATIVYSGLVFRSKQLFPSIIVHTIINSIIPVLSTMYLMWAR